MEWTTVESGTFVSSNKRWPLMLKSDTALLRTEQFVVSEWRVTVSGCMGGQLHKIWFLSDYQVIQGRYRRY